MYYSFRCPYCRKTFYTFTDNKVEASRTLYYGIKEHQKDYGEDAKEFTMDDEYISTEINRVYDNLGQSHEEPRGGYELR